MNQEEGKPTAEYLLDLCERIEAAAEEQRSTGQLEEQEFDDVMNRLSRFSCVGKEITELLGE